MVKGFAFRQPSAKQVTVSVVATAEWRICESIKLKNGINWFDNTLLHEGASSSLLAQVLRGATGSFGLKILSTVLVFFTTLALSRFLGPKGYGNYAFALAWISLLIYPAVLGINLLLTREVARYRSQSDWSSLRGILAWSTHMVLFTSSALALLAAALVWLLRRHMEDQTATTLCIAVGILPFMALTLLREGAIRGLGAVVVAQLPQLFIRPALFLTLVVVSYFAFELTAPITVGIRVLTSGIVFLVATVSLRKYLPESTQSGFSNYHHRRWLRSAFPLFTASAGMMVNEQISVIMVATIMGPEEAGIFDVARRSALFVPLVLIAFNMPLGPTVASLYALRQGHRLQQLVTKTVRLAMLCAFPLALALIICAPWYLLLFGREFTSANVPLVILTLGQLLNVGIGSVGLLLNMTGYERCTALGVVVTAILNGILNATLIPIWGLEGAAVAHVVSLTFFKALLSILVYNKLRIHSTVWGVISCSKTGFIP